MKKEVVFIVDDEPMHAQMMEDHLRTKYPTFDIYKYSTGAVSYTHLTLPTSDLV